MGPRDTYVLRTVEERGVRFVRLWFVDVLGVLKSLAVPASELEATLEEGVGLDGSALEGAARVRERDVIAHPDALSMADAITTFRLAVKEVASELDLFATFMPKPLQEHAGSGMHLHLSLFDGDRNAFHDPDPAVPLAALGRHFLAGILAHAS